MTNYFEKHAQTLYDNGYSVIPLEPKEKYPLINGWQTKYRKITQHQLGKWLKDYPSHGIGIQTFNTPAIDIDVRDAVVAEKIYQELTAMFGAGVVLRRVGEAPKFLIPCQTNIGFKKINGQKFFGEKGEKHQVEIHCDGQQFVTFGYHKGAKADYKWVSEKSLLEVKRTDLPMIDHALAIEIKDRVEQIITDETNWGTKDAGGKVICLHKSQSPVVSIENIKPPVNKTSDELKATLELINADDRDIWIKVGMGLHHQYQGSDEGLALWDEWSQSSHKYSANEMQNKWKSFKRDNVGKAVTAATILALVNIQNSDDEPKPLKEIAHKVMPFDADKMLPASLAPFVEDAAKRMACSADFIGVSIIPVLTSIIGSQAIINVKKCDKSHKVYPTAWAMIIGEPSLLKSPCVQMVMSPLNAAQTHFETDFKAKMAHHKSVKEFMQELSKDKKEEAKKLVKKDPDKAQAMFAEAVSPDIEPPQERHLIANDATVEILQIMMQENHGAMPYSGVLYYRDELSSHLETLSREDRSNERGFFMQCFNGYGEWRVNRVTRDKVVIPNTNISILGTIQPAKIARHVRSLLEGKSNDGLFQRYQFAIYPQKTPRQWVDIAVDEQALQQYEDVIEQLLNTDFLIDGQPSVFKFNEEAQALYQKFYEHMCNGINSENNHSALKNHLAKMDKTIATLALLFELVNNPHNHNYLISLPSMMLAYNWFDYLKSHAEAVYAVANHADEEGAALLIARRDKIDNVFTIRDIKQKHWIGLKTTEEVEQALQVLEESNHIQGVTIPTTRIGGRPTIKYRWNK